MLFISVIIPNYNHASFLEERIESIVNQTYQNFEVIILDDNSTDDSKHIIEKYRAHPKITNIIYNTTNSGSPFKQWKKGIELAQGNWIWIAESDDYADKYFLQRAAQAITDNPTIGLFYCDAYIVTSDETKSCKRFSEKKNTFFKTKKWANDYLKNGTDEVNESLKFFCTINNASSMVFKKPIAGPLLSPLEKYIYHGDWFFYIQIALQTNLYYSHQPLNYYRDHYKSHLNQTVFNITKKIELFKILKVLYYNPHISNRQKLINHFCGYFLSFGLLEDGMKAGFRLISGYAKIDARLSVKILLCLCKIKLLRKKYIGWDK